MTLVLAATAAKEIDMQDNRMRKLKLNRETIRALTTDQMAGVVGGWFTATWACPTRTCQTNGCPSGMCPAPPLTSPGHCTNGCTVAIAPRKM